MALSPAAWARSLPFALFMGFLALRGQWPQQGWLGLDGRWIYALGVLVVGAALALQWRHYEELARAHWPRLRDLLLSVAVGLGVMVLWIHLDQPWMQLGQPSASFVPVGPEGELLWGQIAMRWVGAALLVPVMEELFWRGFLMRWVQQPDFSTLPATQVGLRAVLISTLLFMLAHTLWLAAIVAGLAYALLYRYTGSLWTAVLAHAVTNGVLGAWVVYTRQWQFW
ncbi:CAAX prenyl protease-related protein [Roseateles sp. BYS180W]|uniref:CAAX prenyl protease-related protein n=1 Tax=Roseateles rivi TaxID=3299028 RepID=A0ABW7FU56_9BURK